MTLGSIIAAFVIAFVKGWLLAFIFIGIFPFIGIAGGLYAKAITVNKQSK